jgi:hypothetical protein
MWWGRRVVGKEEENKRDNRGAKVKTVSLESHLVYPPNAFVMLPHLFLLASTSTTTS